MYCTKCGKQIPDDANVCQYCGVSTKVETISTQKPKKKHGCLFWIICCFVAILVIGGCTAIVGHNHKDSASSGSSSSVQQKQRAYKMGETFKSDAFEVTITGKDTKKKITDQSGYISSTANGVFLVVHVHYKNIAKSAKSLDRNAFTLAADGNQYSPTVLTVRMNENIFYSTINPGIEKDGEVYFDIPEEVAKSNLTLKMSSSFMSDNFSGEVDLF